MPAGQVNFEEAILSHQHVLIEALYAAGMTDFYKNLLIISCETMFSLGLLGGEEVRISVTFVNLPSSPTLTYPHLPYINSIRGQGHDREGGEAL
ncbi:MAG: hypothetical protein DMG06_22490 [Acidobacteria bacterium]|nr:MAG: hypothetical protein DMG06_22490 [Acidobacteriota bacterium]